MPAVTIQANVAAFTHDLTELRAGARARIAAVLNMYGSLGVTLTKANAQSFHHTAKVITRGPNRGKYHFPDRHVGGYLGEGPNVRTSKYQGSIGPHEVFTGAGDEMGVRWGSSAVQSMALEMGNPPTVPAALPHFRPALDDLEEPFVAAVAKAVVP